jgi:hypothetical protein
MIGRTLSGEAKRNESPILMIDDIVVDTNVFVHAHNRGEPRQAEACEFLRHLWNCNTKLCIDEGFNSKESQNRSQIYSEYIRHLKPGMLGFALVGYLAASKRVKEVSRAVPRSISGKIRQSVKKTQDRIYVQVSYKSVNKILASHDFGDFNSNSRKMLRKDINVIIMTVGDVIPDLE